MRHVLTALAAFALTACGTGEAPKKQTEPEPVEAAETPKVDPHEVEPAAPASPAEMVEASGMTDEVATAIGEPTYDLKAKEQELVALRTGVLAAEVMVGHRSLSNDQLAAHIDAIRAGLAQVGAGSDAEKQAGELAEKVRAGAVSRDELQTELDHIADAFPAELEKQGKAWAKPFFEAGSWVRTTNLLAMVLAKKPTESGLGATNHTEAIAYFRKELNEKGKGKASDKVLFTVDRTLERLRVLTSKKEPLAQKDFEEIATLTGSLLDLVREPPAR